MFLTPKETGGPLIFALRRSNQYLAIKGRWDASQFRAFDIRQLAEMLGRSAGETWQEHASLIALACMSGRLFEWPGKITDRGL